MGALRTEVEFIEDWMGNPKGSKKVILTNWAMELVKRGQAALVKEEKEEKEGKEGEEPKKEEEVKEEEVKKEEEEVDVKDKKEVENKETNKFKMMGKSVKDKMFKGSKNK